jgi:hypothetical protein
MGDDMDQGDQLTQALERRGLADPSVSRGFTDRLEYHTWLYFDGGVMALPQDIGNIDEWADQIAEAAAILGWR